MQFFIPVSQLQVNLLALLPDQNYELQNYE